MLAKLTLITLWTTFAFRPAFAQTDLGTLPRCAQNCVSAVAQTQNCVLLTQQCLCPAELDIHQCISRSFRLEDLGPSNSIVNSFCQSSASSSTTPSSPSLPSTKPSTPPLPPRPTNTQTFSTLPPPSNTLSLPSIPSTSSTTSTASSSSPAVLITLTPTPTPSSLSTTGPLQTVIVFSTQFAPPAPPTLNNNGRGLSFSRPNAEAVTCISIILSGFMGAFLVA